ELPASLDLCRLPDLAPARILSTPGYAQLAVSVIDSDGAPITGLKQTDFALQFGSKLSPIVYFRDESRLTTPVSMVIVGDVSESMFRKTVVESPDELAKARIRLIQSVDILNQCDEVALVMIGGTYLTNETPPLGAVTLAQPYTTNLEIALRKMFSVKPSGEKRLSDGLRMGLETLSGAHYPNRALVLMTDGLDQPDMDQSAPLLAQLRESGISFWVVGIGDSEAKDSMMSKLRGTTRLDMAAVKNIATNGGGQALFAKPVASDNGASLAAAVTTIGNHLGQGYALGTNESQQKTVPAVTLNNHSGAAVRVELVPSEVLAAAAARPALPKREVGTARNLVAPESIRNRAGYTEIAATVAKADGSYVDGLSKGDFNLSVNGTRQPIDFFQAGEESSATVGILVDTSGSMESKIPQARAAIEQFVKALDPMDEMFLIAFSGRPYMLLPLTNDHDALIKRLALLHAYGQTALFDAVTQGIAVAQVGHNRRKVLLVITDGIDNTSTSSADDVVNAAKSSGVLVYSIGIGDPNGAQMSTAIGPYVIGGDDTKRVDSATLSRLATANGSKSYIFQTVGNGEALQKACEEIAADLQERHSYAIGFVAHAPANYTPTTMPIAVHVPTHVDYRVQTPELIPAPPTPDLSMYQDEKSEIPKK
ncbi:MAG TPA: VWA domain-containing protein, partial [Candidatus Dormibacteraeota bacterium]|nr:VWA domain-containing protein [Candidatus Dormibacteraeota bacterium]